MKLNDALKIAVLPGDGIGVEVMAAALPVFDVLGVPVELSVGEIGWTCWQQEANPIPPRTWRLIERSDAVLLGAITSKPPREAELELALSYQRQNLTYVSPLIQLRQYLDLYANVRPCFNVIKSEKEFTICVIRENTEGLYAGFDYHPIPESLQTLIASNPRWQMLDLDDVSATIRLQTKAGLQRLFHYAFEYAKAHGMSRVTFADKPNVLRQSSEFARLLFEEKAAYYPDIAADILNVDAVAMWLIRRPEQFGVIVAENMFGDILSDVGAGMMGGLGFAASANIGLKGCYFEPVHGSAPRMLPNSANPGAMFLSIGLLLQHFGYAEQATIIKNSVMAVVNAGRFVTYDQGGKATTKEMASAIIDQCECFSEANKPSSLDFQSDIGLDCFTSFTKTALNDDISMKLQQLQAFTTADISDALDAHGVEGALFAIKPLLPGHKVIGPAYTVKYLVREQSQTGFHPAADYIDNVPAGAVLVIDNNGQTDCTVWGGILTEVAQLRRLAGTIVNGAVRDIQSIQETNFPVFCKDVFMRSGKNRVYKAAEQCPVLINAISINPGDIIMADDNGVIVIPVYLLDDVIHKAQYIQLTEKNILAAVASGESLKQARARFRYDKPWLACDESE